MTPAEVFLLTRDAVYTAINTKKTAEEFTLNNSFDLKRTWRPWAELERFDPTDGDLKDGRVYVIGARIDDIVNQSRSNMVQVSSPVHVGFQRAISNVDNYEEVDNYVRFLGELIDTCRLLTDITTTLTCSFSRLEWLRDPDGVPLSFIHLRESHFFEAYFTAYYTSVLAGYDGED
jgi:hypothetical protein